jgi:hypothetical protein
VTANSLELKDFETSKAYSAAFKECSEPSIATIIFENFECEVFNAEDNLVLYDNVEYLIKRNHTL